MTREIIEGAKESIIPFIMGELRHYNVNGNGEVHAEQAKKDLEEIFSLAIKALEQEPKFMAKSDGTIEQIKNCNDCIFRKEWEKIGKLLSAVLKKQTEQEPKEGHWIKTPKAVMGEGYMWYCDKCEHQVYQDSSRPYPSEKYCPNCGAKMAESEKT